MCVCVLANTLITHFGFIDTLLDAELIPAHVSVTLCSMCGGRRVSVTCECVCACTRVRLCVCEGVKW